MSNLNNIKVRSTAASGSQVYESKRAVDEYLLFHFGKRDDLMPYNFGPMDALDFPERCAKVCIDISGAQLKGKALDIGCSVGGSSFSLANHFNHVVGIDFSQHFVDAANCMKKDGSMAYDMLQQGDLYRSCIAQVPASIDKSRVEFSQGDACNLSPDLGG